MGVPVLIAARLGSSRLPKKLLLDLGGIPVIEHIVRRCEHFGFEPFISCNNREDAEAFNAETSCLNVFGETGTVEATLTSCALHYGLKVFHQIDADDPFFCRDMVLESIQCLRMGKISHVLPSIYSQCGGGLVGTSYNLAAPSDSHKEILPDPPHPVWPQRLTLDYEEDYHLICAVNRMVGGYMAPRWAVDQLFERNPDLHKINWFRNQEWKEKQRRDKYRK